MGGTSALLIGSNVDEQLAPYRDRNDNFCNLDDFELYHLGWTIGPCRFADWTDWRFAFKLKQGQTGDPRFVSGDEPPCVAYSAIKGAIDFEEMRREIEAGAGQVWDMARTLGIAEWGTQTEAVQYELVYKKLDTLLKGVHPNLGDYRFAWANFVDESRLHYPRERYIDLRSKARFGAEFLISKGKIESYETMHASQKILNTTLKWDAWLDYLYDFVCVVPDDTLISQIRLRQ
jgi:hypothetical protein